jgi:sec-independent protein translocase protein TatB
MFDVSFTELMVIGVVALVVIGPERLPKVARTLGHLVGRAQRYVNDVKADIQREVELDGLKKFKDQVQEAAQTVHSSLNETHTAISDPLKSFEQTTMSALQGSAPDAGLAATSTAAEATVQVHDSASALAHLEAAEPASVAVTTSAQASETSAQASETSAQAQPLVPLTPTTNVATSVAGPQQLEIEALLSDTAQPNRHTQTGAHS